MKQLSLLATVIYIPFIFIPILCNPNIPVYIKISSVLVSFLLLVSAGLYFHKHLKRRKKYMTLPVDIENASSATQELYREIMKSLTKDDDEND